MTVSASAMGRKAGTQKIGFIIAASSIGTLIEWYDFYLYGVLAGFFAAHFFPGDMKNSFLFSLGIFWTGFVVRPFGAVFFGHLGDLIGRKFTFMLTLVLMGLATFLVGCLPVYDTIGWLAPVLLVACRVVQGLALGGEYGGAATYIAEHAPDGKRGLYTSWIQTTATFGIVLALLVILAFRLNMSADDFAAYGWRYPFLLSAVLVVLSGYIRLRLQESPLYAQLKSQGKSSHNPVADTYSSGRNVGKMLIALFGATAPEGVVWYTGQFYALFYLTTVLKIPFVQAYSMLVVALVIGSTGFIFFGWLSDKIGRKWIMTTGFALAVVTYIPVFQAMAANKDSAVTLTLLILYMVILVTMVYGPIAAFLVEFFPAKIRYSSMSLPYHVGNGVFGGGVPFIGGMLATTSLAAVSLPIVGVIGPLVGLLYPMSVASLGVVVSLFAIPNTTSDTRIWDEVGGKQRAGADD
ncbi:MAG: MFS transporter [Stellaceae bacterium]